MDDKNCLNHSKQELTRRNPHWTEDKQKQFDALYYQCMYDKQHKIPVPLNTYMMQSDAPPGSSLAYPPAPNQPPPGNKQPSK